MTIVAHRCGTDLFPESTLAAARHSLALGADYLEIDIRFTRDGIPVISHDADLRRLFGDEEKICKLSAEDFHSRRHIARPDFGPAFLEEFFDAGLGSLLFHVKEGGASLEKLISAVERRDYGSKVVFGVCSVRDAHILRNSDSGYRVLGFIPEPSDWRDFATAGAGTIRLWEKWANAALIEEIHAAGCLVWIMTGRLEDETVGYTTRERVEFLLAMKADGILINEVGFGR